MSLVLSTTPPAADRRDGWVRLVPLAMTTVISVGLAADSVSFRRDAGMTGFGAGAIAALMAVFLLRSVPAAWAARGVLLVGTAMLVQFGEMPVVGAAPSGRFLLWASSTAVSFVLAQRLEVGVGAVADRAAATKRTILVATAAACLVAGGMLVAGPAGTELFSSGVAPGARPGPEWLEGNSALREPGVLDMTTRPRLSDRIVLSIRADRPSFWRTRTYDHWDGRSWFPASYARQPVLTEVRPAEFDLGATVGEELIQEVRIEAEFAELLPAAPSAVQVNAAVPLAQTSDGDLAPLREAFGKGATYTVVSRQPVFTEEGLRAAEGEVPAAILERYAAEPVATDRVRALAEQLVGGIDGTYEKVRAIEDWMGANTTYSLDAPLSPAGVDVVDHFLFESREGWCEQIASSLVVLLRLSGVPARLVTGYVSGERDIVSGRFQIRESDAHAWTEVWFPGVGWVPFDPTAEVPFTGGTSSAAIPATEVGIGLIALAIVVLAAGPIWSAVTGAGAWMRSRRQRRKVAARLGPLEVRLEQLGAARGRAREPDETLTAYARELAVAVGDPRVAGAGELADRARYAPEPPGADEQAATEHLLDELISASAPPR